MIDLNNDEFILNTYDPGVTKNDKWGDYDSGMSCRKPKYVTKGPI